MQNEPARLERKSPGPDETALPRRSLRGIDWLNFFLADVQTGVGPFLAIYLASQQWNPQQVGVALMVGGLAGIATQTPAGALVDTLRQKRALIGIGIIALCVGSLAIALRPTRPVVFGSQVLIGGVSSVFIPAIAAISLGVVGHQLFDRRQGRNQSFNAAGNVVAALVMGWVGWKISSRSIFFLVLLIAIPAILSLLWISPKDIDYERARGASADAEAKPDGRSGLRALLSDHPLRMFLVCAVLFHFANAAMLPLAGEMLSEGKGQASFLFMSACIVVTQFVITLLGAPAGRLAGSWGRKPILLIGFGALLLRGVLFSMGRSPTWVISVQVLDGIGAGIFNVVAVLVIVDLTAGTGRFNLASGAIATAQGIGASLSQALAGGIVHHAGYTTGFIFLSAVAAIAFGMLLMFVPETCNRGGSSTPPDVAAHPAF